MLSSIEKLLHALEESGITYCHWKSNEHLADALEGETDLDMLFDYSQRAKLESVFGECGLKRFRATPLMQYNGIEDYIGFDQTAARIWHVHTHYRMTLGEKHLKGYMVTPWASILLRDRVRGEAEVWTSDPGEELAVLICRIALKLRWRDCMQKLGKDDRTELAWLKARVTKEQLEIAAKRLVSEDTAKRIVSLYESDLVRKPQFASVQKALRKEFRPFSAYSRAGSWFARTKREVYWLVGGVKRRLGLNAYSPNRRISPAGGLTAAILGCDGAGKSTTLSYIRKEFNKKIDTVCIYFGSGDGSSSLIRKPMKLVAKKIGGKGVGHAVEKEYAEKKVSCKARLYSLAKILWAISLAAEKKKKQRRMAKAKNKGMLVLTDRYPQSIVPGASDGPLLSKYRQGRGLLKRIADWEQRIYERFSVNAPDLTIKLIVPTETAIERKPEMTVEEIENKKSIVMQMDFSEHTAVIDTSRPFEVTRGEVMNEIWKLI